MSSNRLVRYVLALAVGGAAAFIAAPYAHQAFAGDPHAHVQTTRLVPAGTDIHTALLELVESLEQGSVTIDRITRCTDLLLEGIDASGRPDSEARTLGLQFEGKPIGQVSMPAVLQDGRRDWVFELELSPPRRYGKLARTTELTITFSGYGDTINFLSALTETHVHARESTIPFVSEPLVVGGCYRVDEQATRWNTFVLDVEIQADGIPVWNHRIGKVEPREHESLRTDGISVVAATLFAL